MADFSPFSSSSAAAGAVPDGKRKTGIRSHGRLTDCRRAVRLLLPALLASLLAVPAAVAQDVRNTGAQTPAASNSLASIAAGDLDAYPEIRHLVEQRRYAEALSALQSMESRHENDPGYFNLLGILALKIGDYGNAAASFERVVLMQPDNAGAWLDLAIASAESGKAASAAGYFDYIETQFNPPAELRAVITQYRNRMAAQSRIASPWQIDLDAMAGVDSNANNGPLSSTVPLTFGAQRIDLVLDPTFQARSDNFAQVGAAIRRKYQLGDTQAEFSSGIRSRSYQHEHDFSTLNVNIGAGLRHQTSIGEVGGWLQAEHLSLGGHALLRNARAIAQLEHPYRNCRLGFAVEAEWRRYNTLTNLDGNLYWGQAGLACDWNLQRIPVQATLIGRAGVDIPTGDRAGGRTAHNELIAQIGLPLAWGARADFSATFSAASDTEGYSTLLEQNAVRHLDRRNLRFTLTYPLTTASDLVFLAEDNRYQSNISLFEQSGKGLSVGFRRRF